MIIKAAVFDVDGTLVRTNVTYLFLRHLLDNRILEPEQLRDFSVRYLSAQPNEFPLVIAESLQLFSYSNFQQLQPHWDNCFETAVIPAFNQSMVDRIRELREQHAEIILASGSFLGLIARIGEELGIPEGNILATRSPKSICFGETKRKEVLHLLEAKKIPLSQTVFFSDNISDIKLLSQAGQGFWTGKTQEYINLGLSQLGIENAQSEQAGLTSQKDAGADMESISESELLTYYQKHLPLIERSVQAILPNHCTAESMEYLVGPIELSWDLATLDESFFQPAHAYLNKKKIKWHCLGTCLFMEAGGLNPERYIPLIAVTELLDTSSQMFTDIREWSKAENFASWHTSRMGNAITGNVSIALISMVTHNLIYNRLPVDARQKLAIYESLTSAIFNSLFGNGLKLFQEEQPAASLTEDEYHRMAELLYGGILRFYFDLWNILGHREVTADENALRETFLRHMSIAIQLSKDRGTALLESVQWKGSRHTNHLDEAFKALQQMNLAPNLSLPIWQYLNHLVA